jgi:CDP-glycerol glycerophosphotransferase (TagB/SpsB family)
VRDFLISHGRKETEVVVTGNPAFDGLADPAVKAQAVPLRAQMLGLSRQKLLLFASSVEPAEHPFHPGVTSNAQMHSDVARKLQAWQLSQSAWQCWIKPHPSQAAAFGAYHEGLPVCKPEWPMHALLHAADAVLVTTSTVAVEAAQIDKPAFRVRGSMFDHATPFESMGICRAGCELVQLPFMLNEQLAALQSGDFARPSALQPGRAAKAVAQQIESLLCRPAAGL